MIKRERTFGFCTPRARRLWRTTLSSARASNTQVKALADAAEDAMTKAGEEPHHIEGHRGNQWTLMDYSAVVVHIFTEEGREFYDLERLWSDAEQVDLAPYLADKTE